MFKLLVLTSLLTSVTLAQSTTNNSSTNTLIPSDISPECSTFLNALNTDATLASCLTTLTNITSAFAPGGTTPTSSDVTSTLSELCTASVTSMCPESLIRTQLTSFFAACSDELTSNAVQSVRNIYDVLYILLPLQTSICSKDDSGKYCALGPEANARDFDEDASFSISDLLALLYIKNDNGALTRREVAIVPNISTISANNLQFLFFQSDSSPAQLCVTCLRQVLTAYINFEEAVPFAYGMNNSELLGPQIALYNAVQANCSGNFLSGSVQAAGGLSGTSSAIPTCDAKYQSIIALVVGAVTMVISVAL